MLKEGDKVKFLNEVGGGIISKILDKKKALILTDDGFDIPVMLTELILMESAADKDETLSNAEDTDAGEDIFTGDDEIEEEDWDDTTLSNKEKTEEQEDIFTGDEPEALAKEYPVAIFLALVPKDKKRTAFELHIINDSHYTLYYTLSIKKEDTLHHVKAGILEQECKILVSEYSMQELTRFPDYVFQALLFRKKPYKFREPFNHNLNIQPISLQDEHNMVTCDFFKEKCFLYPIPEKSLEKEIENISGKEINKIISQKEKKEDKPQLLKKDKKTIRAVDLHIQELVEDERGLSNKDMLDLQLLHFRRELDETIKKQEKRIVFIHGKGNGRLKLEIIRILEKDYPRLSYQDASFQEYGFGATMVLL